MDLSDKEALQAAIARLADALRFSLTDAVKVAYLAGIDSDGVGYEKLVGRKSNLAAFGKYMLVAESFLLQPNVHSFYDIFRAARVIPLLRALDRAVTTLRSARCAGLEARLERLAAAIDLDLFDSILFELVVAARYGRTPNVDRLEFVSEDPNKKTPDFKARLGGRTIYVECKRIDRMTAAAITLRNEVNAIARPLLADLRGQDIRAAIRVQFDARPSSISPAALAVATNDALAATGQQLLMQGFSLSAEPLVYAPLEDYVLFPSPKFFWERYGYRASDWHGLVHSLAGVRAGPSFLDEVRWDSGLMWQVQDEDLLWSIQRLPFTRFFEGIEQLAETGTDTYLHVWFERSAEHGDRRAHLLKLSETLATKSKEFAWIIANETFFDVSIGGRFDFQEHASGLGGTLRATDEPPVATVFVGEKSVRGVGEWGIGIELPPIDDEPWSDTGDN